MDIWLSRMTINWVPVTYYKSSKSRSVICDFLMLPLREIPAAAVLAYLRVDCCKQILGHQFSVWEKKKKKFKNHPMYFPVPIAPSGG